MLEFRAQNFDTEAAADQEIDAIVDSTNGYLSENFTDIQLDDPKDVTVDGQPGAQLAGSGKDQDGNEVEFISAIIALGPNSLAEIWAWLKALVLDGQTWRDTAYGVVLLFTGTIGFTVAVTMWTSRLPLERDWP